MIKDDKVDNDNIAEDKRYILQLSINWLILKLTHCHISNLY